MIRSIASGDVHLRISGNAATRQRPLEWYCFWTVLSVTNKNSEGPSGSAGGVALSDVEGRTASVRQPPATLATQMAAYLPDSARDLAGATDAVTAGHVGSYVGSLFLAGWVLGG
jgi:hypothetical protein